MSGSRVDSLQDVDVYTWTSARQSAAEGSFMSHQSQPFLCLLPPPPPPLPLPYSNWHRMEVIASAERVGAAARGTHSAPGDAAEPAARAHCHASGPRAQPLRLPTWTGGVATTRAASAPERSDLRASIQVSLVSGGPLVTLQQGCSYSTHLSAPSQASVRRACRPPDARKPTTIR